MVRVSPLGLVTVHRPSLLDQPVGRVHPVQRLVGAAVGVDGHAAVGLDHDQPGGHREVGGESTLVVDRAAGDDEAHGGDGTAASRSPGERRYRVEWASGDQASVDLVAGDPLGDELAALLELAVGEALEAGVDAEAGLHAGQVELARPSGSTPISAAMRSPWVCGEVHRDVGDLGEQVEVGGQAWRWRRRGTPCSSRRASAPWACGRRSRAGLHHLLDLADQLVGGQLVVGSIGGPSRSRSTMTASRSVSGGQRAEVAERGELHPHVVHRGADEQAQEGQALAPRPGGR